MSEILNRTQTYTIYNGVYYPEEREDDMGESSFHNKLRMNLFLVLNLFLKKRTDVFMTANMNIYYIRGNVDGWFAPDILISFGVPNYERNVYKLWEEKIFSQVIFEIASDRIWKTDVEDKLKFYEQLGAEEYYILDSENGKHLSSPILAFHRQNEQLLPVPIVRERVFSPRLELEIVRTENDFRLFNANENKFLPTLEKSQNEIEKLKAKIERLEMQKRKLMSEIGGN